MDDDILRFIELEVRNVECPERFDRPAQGFVCVAAASRRLQVPPHLAERAQATRTIETLPLTVFAERHGLTLMVGAGPVNADRLL
jgi:hypothetical protein